MSHDPSEIILICSFGAQITFLIIIDIEKLCYIFVETMTFFRILWIFTRVALFDLLFNNVKVLSLLVKCNASLLNKSIYFCKKQQQLTHLKMIDTKINIYLSISIYPFTSKYPKNDKNTRLKSPLHSHPPLKTPNQWISRVWIWDFDTCI